jgi:hypothetical protein
MTEDVARLVTDKLTEEFTLKIPEVTKQRLDKLTKSQKKFLNERLLVAIARVLHEAEFDPIRYLVDDYTGQDRSAR